MIALVTDSGGGAQWSVQVAQLRVVEPGFEPSGGAWTHLGFSEIELTYNVILVSGVQHDDFNICIY